MVSPGGASALAAKGIKKAKPMSSMRRIESPRFAPRFEAQADAAEEEGPPLWRNGNFWRVVGFTAAVLFVSQQVGEKKKNW